MIMEALRAAGGHLGLLARLSRFERDLSFRIPYDIAGAGIAGLDRCNANAYRDALLLPFDQWASPARSFSCKMYASKIGNADTSPIQLVFQYLPTTTLPPAALVVVEASFRAVFWCY